MKCKLNKVLIIVLIGLLLPSFTFAKKSSKKRSKTKAKTTAVRTVPKATKEITVKKLETKDLYASAIDVNPRIINQIHNLDLQRELEIEDELYPSDDLYGSWNNEYLNVYANVEIPDTFTIDVSSYVPPVESYVTSKFGPRKRRMHYGTDLKVHVGDTIRAAFDGKIRIKEYERKGYGYYLVVRHQNGLETVYGHLSDFLVDVDDVVKAGQPIGLGGNTGRSTGPHLHFETRFLGRPINPELILDFENHVAIQDTYVFEKTKIPARGEYASNSKTNKYTNGKVGYYKIRKGDTLGGIARKKGVSINTLCKLNNIKPTTTLRPGRSIRCS